MSTTQTSSTSLTKNSYHHGELRTALLNAAALMIREEGEAALSMRRLAERVGVSRTAAYHHFRHKQDLLCSVAEEGFRRFDVLAQSLQGINDIEQYLQRHIRGYVRFALENAEYYDLMFSGRIWRSEGLTDSLQASSHACFQGYVERMAAVCENYRLPPGVTPLRFAQIVWSTLHGLSRLVIDGIYVEKTAIEAICDASVTLLLQQVDRR